MLTHSALVLTDSDILNDLSFRGQNTKERFEALLPNLQESRSVFSIGSFSTNAFDLILNGRSGSY